MKSKKNVRRIESLMKLTPVEVASRVERALALVREIQALFPDMPALSPEERAHSLGRFREGEDEALVAILDVVDRFPKLFDSLADRDHGHDPKKVETAPTRDDLARRAALARLAEALADAHAAVADGVMVLGDHARQITIPAYAIAKVHSPLDRTVATLLEPAVTLYSEPARTRKQNKRRAKKAPRTSPTPQKGS